MRKVILLLFIFCLSCDGDPIFSNLDKSDIIIVFKATYSSNNPRNWWGGTEPAVSALVDDSATHSTPKALPDKVLIDVAEVRVNNDRFSIKRFFRNAEINDSHELFSGKGVTVPTSDLFPDVNYNKVKVFFRKLIYNNSLYYDDSWEYIGETEEKFANDKIPGYDTIHRLKYIQSDYDEDEDDAENIVYPFVIELPLPFRYKVGTKTVIEIRVNFKNNVKYYEYADSDEEYYYGYYSIADSFVNVKEGDFYIGGNMQGGVYIYEPDKTFTIKGTAPAKRYVVAILKDDDIKNYSGTTAIPPLATWCEDGTFVLENVQAGREYKFYYSTNTPDSNAGVVEGFSGEKIVNFDMDQVDNEYSLQL
mgnify:CR=1 FL=1